jgi:flagellar basal-body rod protein FlgG
MLAGMERVDTISNNLANAATPAFKKSKAALTSFSDMVARAQAEQAEAATSEETPSVGVMGMGTRVDSTWLVFDQGPLRFTDNSLNAAINGAGFFVVSTPDGERYTRDGRFSMDADGWLVTSDGYQVLGEQGPINVAGLDASIGLSGEVAIGTRIQDRLRIVDFPTTGDLVREGRNLYASENAVAPFAVQADLSPGFSEESNVNVVAEMAELISATRYYEANQKVIQAQDDALGKAVNEVGKV